MQITIRPLLRPRLFQLTRQHFVEPFPLTPKSKRFASTQPSKRRNVRRITESIENAEHKANIPPFKPIPSSIPPSSEAPQQASTSSAPQASISSTLAAITPDANTLLAPVSIPLDPHSILSTNHPAHHLLSHSSLIIQRKLEMMNIFLGFEQANRYTILSPTGETIGYMAEHDGGFGKVLGRQWFRTHRSFMANVFDLTGREVLRFHRPFSWINSRIKVYDPLEVTGGAHAIVSPSTEVATTATTEPGTQQISQVPMSGHEGDRRSSIRMGSPPEEIQPLPVTRSIRGSGFFALHSRADFTYHQHIIIPIIRNIHPILIHQHALPIMDLSPPRQQQQPPRFCGQKLHGFRP